MSAPPSPPVIITGIGVAAPTGLGAADYWSATLRGDNGIRRISRFDSSRYPSRLAGEINNFNPATHIPNRLLPQTDPMTRLAIAAADWALQDAGVDPGALPEFDMGVVTASSSGGFDFGHRELEKLWSKGPEHVSVYQSFAWFYAVNTGQISIRHGMRGSNGVLVSEQAGGLDAIAQARRRVRHGTPLVVTGAVESCLCPWGWVCQMASGRLSTSDDATRAYLPFDVDASGYVPGEGGAILIAECAEAAHRRGARGGYAEIAGYAATFDPRPGSGREPGLRRAATLALADAGVDPDVIDVVFADAAGIPELDRIEAEAIKAVFGGRVATLPVTAPKTLTGRLCSGGSALDVATAVLAIRDGVIPPTPHVTRLAPGIDLDLVTDSARSARVDTALVLARGYGGFNAAMVLRAL